MAANYLFAIMPIEAFMDSRLSKTELRVLGAILSFRNKDTNLCWPSREQISERCRLPLCKISTATTNLVNLGWLKKQGNGGKSSHCKYALCVPDLTIITVTDLGTVTESVTSQTVTELVTQTVTDLVTQTVTELVRGNKQTIEHTNKQTIKPPISPKGGETKKKGIESLFDTFWKAYPRKVGKDKAIAAFKKIKKPSEVLPEILLALEWQVLSHDWTKELGQFIPHPATYLNQGRWQDERPPDNVTWRRRKTDYPQNKKFDAYDAINGGDGYGNKREEFNVIDISGDVVSEESDVQKLISNRPPF